MKKTLHIALALIILAAGCQQTQVTQPITDIGQGYLARGLHAPWDGKDTPTRFCCHSTADKFFFSFEVTDSTLALKDNWSTEKDVEPEDRVEIFFAQRRSLKRPYFCAEIDPAGRVLDYKARYYRHFDYSWNFQTLKTEGDITPWGYRVQGTIDREELTALGIDLDKTFWIGAYQADFNENGDVVWYSLVPDDVEQADFHTPGVMMPCRCTPKTERRGVVVYPDDITSVGLDEWERRIDLAGLDLIGLHAATSNDPIDTLEAFVRSPLGQDFLALCDRKHVDVEYELHALEWLLPRDLFTDHPEWFRMDPDGTRNPDYNMCFSSDEAFEAMRPRLKSLLEWARPTTHRYYLWTDDKIGKFCSCPECVRYSPSEQALLYENRLLKMLREFDPEATLAHLAYQQTLPAPVNVRAEDGVFLEYAPIKRDYAKALTAPERSALQANTAAFPAFSQHILEYWLDESMFSHWKKNAPVPLPFQTAQAARDLADYRSFGAADFTCFAAWLNALYIDQFGPTDPIFTAYGQSFCSPKANE